MMIAYLFVPQRDDDISLYVISKSRKKTTILRIKFKDMKKYFAATLLIFSLIACNSKEQASNKKTAPKTEESKKPEISKEQIAKFKKEVKKSYDELLSFKDKKEFHKIGFGKGGNYYGWLDNIEKQIDDPISKLVLRDGLVVGEIQSMGMEYIKSKGKETETTKLFKKDLDKIFYPKKKEAQIVLTKDETQNIAKGELYGDWTITNSIAKMSYNYKIYKDGKKYIGIKENKMNKPEILIKKGSKFIVQGNKFGEYYTINDSKKMTLYDEDGELTSAGYSAKYNK